MSERLSDAELRELAKVYSRPSSAEVFLDRAGLERSRQPVWGMETSLDFWRAVNGLIAAGGFPGGRRRILALACEEYPANPVFGRAGAEPFRPGPATVDPFGGQRFGGQAVGGREFGGWGGGFGSPPEFRSATDPVFGTLVAVDAVGFSKHGALTHLEWRDGIRQVTARAAAAAGIPAQEMRFNDRGDGFLALVTASVPAPLVVADFTRELGIALAAYNRTRNEEGRIRLRVAMHQGHAIPDGTGLSGQGPIVAARLVDADAIRVALRDDPDLHLALIVSDELYTSVVAEGFRGLDPAAFIRIEVRVPKYSGVAWLSVPGRRKTGPGAGAAQREQKWEQEPSAAASGAAQVAEPTTQKWQFLVSCAPEDNAWGEWIAWALEEAGYRVHLDSFYRLSGDRAVARWHEAVRNSTRTIAVLTRNYLKDTQPASAQWQYAWMTDGRDGIERRLIPVKVDDCDPEGLLLGITPIDLTGRTANAAREHLLEEVEASLRGSRRPRRRPPEFPGPS